MWEVELPCVVWYLARDCILSVSFQFIIDSWFLSVFLIVLTTLNDYVLIIICCTTVLLLTDYCCLFKCFEIFTYNKQVNHLCISTYYHFHIWMWSLMHEFEGICSSPFLKQKTCSLSNIITPSKWYIKRKSIKLMIFLSNYVRHYLHILGTDFLPYTSLNI